MEAIRVKNLCKVYGTKDAKIMALDHINMEIGEGEFVAVMGPGRLRQCGIFWGKSAGYE